MGNLKTRALVLLGVVVFAVILLAPTFFKDELPKGWPFSKPLSLGLDLSGGVYLVYDVVTSEAVKGHLIGSGTSIKRELTSEKIAVTRTPRVNDKGQLELTLLNDAAAERARALIDQQYRTLQFVEKTQEPEGRAKIVYTIPPERATEIGNQAINQSVETLRSRVDQFGVAEPLIQRVGTSRIQLQMPGFNDIERVKRVVGSVAKLEFRLVPQSESASTVTLKTKSGSPVKLEDQILMGGEAVENAQVSFNQGQVEVLLKLNSDGARTFRQITADNIGRQLAVILDGVVYSDPRINDVIGGGSASITGMGAEEAQQLAVVLRAGALPAPLKVVEERTVGPSLGKESIKSGIVAILAGFLFVLVFMVVYYRKAGGIAAGTLALNLVLLVAALSFFGATLTLPGLAGLALTVGMAVDSNVIIFERIRDELKAGAGRDVAVRLGFDKAYSTIIDTNVTVFLSAVILYYFGTGPIRGFAVTLALGVLTTMFCAVFAARIAFDYFSLRDSKGALSI